MPQLTGQTPVQRPDSNTKHLVPTHVIEINATIGDAVKGVVPHADQHVCYVDPSSMHRDRNGQISQKKIAVKYHVRIP